ncbi:MAG: NAD(P)-dependent oxidoreductase [Paramuribaculum sp.]|nr:NAD(P)-dependent oxidoreductase [Paramuribaculum sp.]
MSTDSNTPKRVLVVGAGGFIGGFICSEALKRGFETWAAVRSSTNRKWLDDNRLNFITLSYDSPEDMGKEMCEALPDDQHWDYIIYNLGATKCMNFADFNRINYEYLRNFLDALRISNKMPQRLLFMSSLSALGRGDEKHYTPLKGDMIPMPDTRYGVSKIKAETLLDMSADVPWTIFRPTGVYGPHEQDYLMMIKSIDRHWDVGMGYRKQMLTFIYVDDLVTAMFQAIESPATLRKKYIISEPRAYTQKEFRTIVARELGTKWVIPLKLPMWAVYAASVVAEKWGVAKMQPSTLNRDKFKIMRQRNWSCDISPAQRDFGFSPAHSLAQGIHITVQEYLHQKHQAKEGKKS